MEKQIQEELRALRENIDFIGKAIEGFGGSLDAILLPDNPVQPKEVAVKGEKDRARSSMGETLRQLSLDLQNHISLLESFQNRLDI